MDGSGVVTALGEGVANFAIGDEVVGLFGSAGTFAEVAVVHADANILVHKPANLDFVTAAAIPGSGLTSVGILAAAELAPDEKTLIIGATGGVGTFLTQLASQMGAYVIVTATGADANDLLSLGAKETIDHRSVDTLAEVRNRHGQVDVILDLVNFANAIAPGTEVLSPGGRVVSPLGGLDADAFERTDAEIRAANLTKGPGVLADVVGRVATGELKVNVQKVYPLDQAWLALYDAQHGHVRGKLVISAE